MKLETDGTISFPMPRRAPSGSKSATRQVKLRRPEMEELFTLWEEIDRISADTGDEDNDDAVPRRRKASEVVESMKTNLQWTRRALFMLGPEGLYAEDGDGDLVLADEDISEPGWFVNGTLAGQWLIHWQSVPPVHGSGVTK